MTTHRALPLLLAAFAFSACESSIDPNVGSIEVTATTTGEDLDADGYTVSVGTEERPLGVNGDTVTFTGLETGQFYSVSLEGIADNCTVGGGGNPQSAPVVFGPPERIAFPVTCEALEEEAEPMTLVAADRDGNIYTVDEETGAETLIASPVADDGAGGTAAVGVVSSMVHIPSTDAWWLGMGGNSSCPACILTLDLGATPEAVELVDLSDELNAVPGLAVDPVSGVAYTTEADGSGILYELDPTTGDRTMVEDALEDGSSGKGATFSLDGVLYIASDDELTEVSVVDFSSSSAGTFTYSGFPAFTGGAQTIGSMATRADGTVFGILKDGGGQGNIQTTYLVTIDLATQEVTHVGANTNALDGLAYVPTRLIP